MSKEIKKNKQNNLIYIIDNFSVDFQTDRQKNLVEIFRQKIPQCSVKVIHYSQVGIEILKSCKGIILTGSEINVSEFYGNKVLRKKFKSVLKIIKKAKNIPILAICYGFHLTGFAFNGKVYRMNIPHDGGRIIPLVLNKTDELILHNEITVDIQHRDYILPDDVRIQRRFEILATKVLNGYNTIQYMRHINRPIYSVQFHPETHLANYTYRNQDDEEIIKEAKQCGEEIIINFANICNQ
ncbi:MAG: gamma-glutamyl-gamma-aminobutyrate hydrolase family protein [Candidatus Lokiarchaeota archaeon]|nr:gamma-glutamyl-gamma-aminobutyrate hydrolase family protein [Candidatus Lokiarchaeota archaeon]